MYRRGKDLTKGDISSTLIKLALPIMGTSLVNMLYNLTDMMWLGRLSTKSVAAAGTAGFYIAFAISLILIAQMGVSIGVSHEYGRNNLKGIRKYIENGIKLNIIIGLIYIGFILLFKDNLIAFFKLTDLEVVDQAKSYLKIVSLGLIVQFFNPVIGGVFNGMGNSVTPFRVNSIGLLCNIVLDPILIFGLGPIPGFGIKGAAIATVTAQIVVFILFVGEIIKTPEIFSNIKIFSSIDRPCLFKILELGIPSFLGSGLRTLIGIIIAKILANWGPVAIAVQSTGVQIESISWMSADGFAMALAAFTGQNYGVGNYERVREGYIKSLKIVSVIGVVVTFIFMFFGASIFRIFMPEDLEAIRIGERYLRIIGLSQIFMIVEITTSGVFSGLGKPKISAFLSVFFNALRIPLGYVLSSTFLDLDGMWWAISGTSIVKGVLAPTICFYILNKLNRGLIDEGKN